MKIVMDIPESIAADFTRDRFEDFFQRVLADMNQGCVCGNYEREIAEALTSSFKTASVCP